MMFPLRFGNGTDRCSFSLVQVPIQDCAGLMKARAKPYNEKLQWSTDTLDVDHIVVLVYHD